MKNMQSVVGEFCARSFSARAKRKHFSIFAFIFLTNNFDMLRRRESLAGFCLQAETVRERDSMAGGRKCVRIEIMAHHNDDGENVGKEEKRVVGL